MKSVFGSLAAAGSFLAALTSAVDVQVTLSNKTPFKVWNSSAGLHFSCVDNNNSSTRMEAGLWTWLLVPSFR